MRIPACRLYRKIYHARNDFLHGNVVSLATLKLGRHSLFQYSAPLFRMALTGFLQIEFSEPVPASGDAILDHIKHGFKRHEFEGYQDVFESALLKTVERRKPRR